MGFAESLQALRKEAKVTQEQLASYLGVSAQAVSKWENGSYPDGDLLPRIADYFQVSIDYLYGREGRRDSIEQQVIDAMKKIWNSDKEYAEQEKDFAEQIERILWAIQLTNWRNNTQYWDRPKHDETSMREASAIALDSCYTFMGLNTNNDCYLFLRQPEGETGYESWFKNTAAARAFFGYLSDEENLMILGYLYTLRGQEYVSADTISKATGIAMEKVTKALSYLEHIGEDADPPISEVNILDGSGSSAGAYGVNTTLGGLIVGILTLVQSYVNPPQGYTMQTTNRRNSWLNRAKLKNLK